MSGKSAKKSSKSKFFAALSFKSLIYRLIGLKFEEWLRNNKSFIRALKAAYIPKTPGQYFAEAFAKALLLGPLIGFTFAFLLSFFIFLTSKTILVLPFFILFFILFSILGIVLVLFIYYLNPFLIASSRKDKLNKEYPFVMRYLEALSATGVPPAAMFKMLAETRVYKESAKEAKRISALVDSGYDIITALLKAADYCPSDLYRRFYISLASTIQAGGNLELFFKIEAERAQKLIEIRYQEFEGIMQLVVQMLIMTVIVFPLLTFSVMLPIKMFQNIPEIQRFIHLQIPVDPGVVILAITYLLTPMVVFMFIMLIKSKAP